MSQGTSLRVLGGFLLLAAFGSWLGVSDVAAQQVSLAWKFRPGDVFYFLIDTQVSHTAEGVPADGNATGRSRFVLLYRYHVLEASQNGYVLEQTVEDVLTDDTSVLGNIYHQFRGLKLKITFDRTLRITKLEGHEELLKRVGADDPVVGKFVAELVNENAIRQQIQSEFNILPEKPVASGDKWQRTISFPAGPLGTITLHQTMTYEGTANVGGKSLDRISTRAKASFTPPKPNDDFPVRVSKGEIQTEEVTGTFLFDREAGRLVSATWQARWKLKLTLAAGKPDASKEFTMEMTQTVNSRTEVSSERPRLPELRKP